jgi:hypothetical protein
MEENCKDPGCSSAGTNHYHLEFSPEETERMKAFVQARDLQHMGAEVERTRTVNIHDHADLLDHLKSDNGHIMGRHAEWRNTHEDDHIPGVRPKDWDDRQMSHQELIALHHHDHSKYDEPHTTLNGEHFHH